MEKKDRKKGRVNGFFGDKTKRIVLIGLAPGLYPLFFYFTNNFMMINSWKHLGFFLALFVFFPICFFLVLNFLLKNRNDVLKKKAFTFFNILAFGLFIQICLTATLQVLYSLLTLLVAVAVAWFLYRFIKKIIAIQFILALLGLFWFVPVMYNYLSYSDDWMEQPDNITEAIFTKRPNVYYIEPDGYLNFSEFNKGFYDRDSGGFKEFLETKNFTLYDGFRSSYNATLPSNTSTFAMRHHYNNIGFNLSEVVNGRKIIITENPVLNIFKNNNYKTHYLAEWPFFLSNLPEMGYDVCNYNYNEVGYVGDGYYEKKDIIEPLKKYIDEDRDKSKFFFIHVFEPGHVEFYEKKSLGAEKERDKWYEKLKTANEKLESVINIITEKDPTALIFIMADHGGYVGYDYMEQIHSKIEDKEKLHSAFSVISAVKWPNNERFEEDSKFKTSVNAFRILFSYLSENKKYLDHLEEDASFVKIEKGAPKGEYKVLDENGNAVFEKL
jgi:hypothetical protein